MAIKDSTTKDQILSITDRTAWRKGLEQRRPLATHLNADTSWLIQLPRPEATHELPRRQTKNKKNPARRRTHFNILIDPWFKGPQTDFAWWFSTQYHVVPSAVKTIKELNKALAVVETGDYASDDDDKNNSYIDALIISHEFTDHCHQATLLELPKDIPVVATDVAVPMIQAWNHFDNITVAPHFSSSSGDWREALVHPLEKSGLPHWLGIGRVMTPGDISTGNLHSAVVIAFDLGHSPQLRMQPRSADSAHQAEALIYTPHGIHGSNLTNLKSHGNLDILGLLHGLHAVKLSRLMQLNLGGANGVEVARMTGAKYWIATHDEAKTASGLVSWILQRIVTPVGDLVGAEYDKLSEEEKKVQKAHFVELASGSAQVLV